MYIISSQILPTLSVETISVHTFPLEYIVCIALQAAHELLVWSCMFQYVSIQGTGCLQMWGEPQIL